MPDRVSAANSMAETSLWLVAYSVRYTAAPTPRGRAMHRVTHTTYRVLQTAGRMPRVPLSTDSDEVRNCQLSWGMPRHRI